MSKYTEDNIKLMVESYESGVSIDDIALALEVSKRSIIAKLTSLGIYKKKQYLTKRGEIPVKKEEYIERIANALDANIELFESLDKVNKTILKMISEALDENIEEAKKP